MATATGGGKQLTPQQIAAVAYEAGFRGSALVTMVAIALAESGGVTGAHNPNGEDSRGLWQINVAPGVRENTWGDLYDPLTNARAAWDVSGQGKNFNPWTTFSGATEAGRNNPHTRHMAVASAAAAEVGGDDDRALANRSTALDTIASGSASTRSGVPTTPVHTPVTGSTRAGNLTVNPDGTVSFEEEDEIKPDSPPEVIEAYIREHYPEVAAFMEGDEAIKWILYDAAINEKDATEFMSAIRRTDYWKSHGPESRAFDALLAEEGAGSATVQQRVGDERTRIENLLSRNGVTLDRAALDKVTMESIRGGWTDAELDSWLADHIRGVRSAPGTQGLGGEVAVSASDLGTTAKSFFVPLTQADLGDWALRIMDGSETKESFLAYVMEMSRGRFANSPEILNAIDRGIAPETYFRPVRNIIADTLELAPDQVDLFADPRFSAISQFYDANNKVNRPMTLGEARQWARNQDEFKGTREYKETEAGLTSSLLREFGMVA